jgi:hypothetical protein
MIKSYYYTVIIVSQQRDEGIVLSVYPCNVTNKKITARVTTTTTSTRKCRSLIQPLDMFSYFSPIHLDYKTSWANK